MHYGYSHKKRRRNWILHSLKPILILNVTKHSSSYAAESSSITFAVIHFLAPCVMQLSVHHTELWTVPFDRQTDWSAMNWNGYRRKSSVYIVPSVGVRRFEVEFPAWTEGLIFSNVPNRPWSPLRFKFNATGGSDVERLKMQCRWIELVEPHLHRRSSSTFKLACQ